MEWNKKKPVGGSKYGLQLKIATPASKRPQLKKPAPFLLEDDDEYTVEDDIARQASKKQTAHEVDVQVKQALEQDSSAFDYDGVYDHMKGQQAQTIREERAKREPKYIGKLLEKAKVRAVEHDIAFERRLAKERDKDEHLFQGKEKFVTNAYKKKLIEQGKWQEEERLRELREKDHEISGKHDLSDFYRNLLHKNVAFGGRVTGSERLAPACKAQNQVHGNEASSVAGEQKILSDLRREGEAGLASGSPPEKHDLGGMAKRIEEDNTREEAGNSNSTSLSMKADENFPESIVKKGEQVPGAMNVKSKDEVVAAAKQRYLDRKKQRTK